MYTQAGIYPLVLLQKKKIYFFTNTTFAILQPKLHSHMCLHVYKHMCKHECVQLMCLTLPSYRYHKNKSEHKVGDGLILTRINNKREQERTWTGSAVLAFGCRFVSLYLKLLVPIRKCLSECV